MTFNYRFSPKHRKIKELLLAGEIGRVTSVDFSWYLDTSHGADYFRRWHRLKSKSGSLWVHKASHHFDLVNWWLDADPVEVSAFGSLQRYGKRGEFHHTNCRACPDKARCAFHWDITKDPRLVSLYVDCEKADGYLRDGCVFKEDVDIPDTMNAIVRYSTGVTMSYSLNAFMPIEGYRLAFNGTEGRLEVRDFERQPWPVPEETEMHVVRNFGERKKIDLPKAEGGHGGGDDVLRDLVFRNIDLPPYMRLPSSRAGAMSCLTGIAARKSMDSGQPGEDRGPRRALTPRDDTFLGVSVPYSALRTAPAAARPSDVAWTRIEPDTPRFERTTSSARPENALRSFGLERLQAGRRCRCPRRRCGPAPCTAKRTRLSAPGTRLPSASSMRTVTNDRSSPSARIGRPVRHEHDPGRGAGRPHLGRSPPPGRRCRRRPSACPGA